MKKVGPGDVNRVAGLVESWWVGGGVFTWGKGQPTPKSKTPEGRRQAGPGLAGSRWQKQELEGSYWDKGLGMRCINYTISRI